MNRARRKRWVFLGMGSALIASLGVVTSAGPEGIVERQESENRNFENRVIADQAGTRRVLFANGLEVVFVPSTDSVSGDSDRDDRQVQVLLSMRAGSVYESDQQRGAAMVVEHVLSMGTSNFSAEQMEGLLEREPMVGFDQTVFLSGFDGVDFDRFEQVLAFFGDVIDHRNMVMSQDRVARAIAMVIEKHELEDSVEYRSQREWLPVLFEGTAFGEQQPMARVDELNRLNHKEVQSFAESWYQPYQATVVVVGDIDADDVIASVKKSFGVVRSGRAVHGVIADGRLGVDVSMRGVLGVDAGFETEQAAIVWLSDRDGDVTKGWSERASEYDTRAMRQTVIDRVAGEIVRHRIKRMSVQAFGAAGEFGVELDQVDLWGQISLVQIGIEHEDVRWDTMLAFIVKEVDRLVRDGAGEDEIERARRSVLSKWHREADDWTRLSAMRRVGLVHWLVTTGRPMIDMVRWDELATELMGSISCDEINNAMREMIDPRAGAYIGLTSEVIDDDATGEQFFYQDRVMGVVGDALDSPAQPIAEDWMEESSDSVMDVACVGGEIDEVSVHPQADVWDVRLDNGVRVLARSVEQGQGRVYLSATVWGDDVDIDAHGEDGFAAAMLAWEVPTTEVRSGQAIAMYMDEYGLGIQFRRDVGYVQINVSGSDDEIERAMELMFVLLDHPMIDGAVFDAWEQGWGDRVVDPIDVGLNRLYRVSRDNPTVGEKQITLDHAQRVLTQVVRNGQIDIAITGDIETEQAIEMAQKYFGSLVSRDGLVSKHGQTGAQGEESRVPLSGRQTDVESAEKDDRGYVIGFVGDGDQNLREIRSLVLASMVLNEQIQELNVGNETSIRAQVAYADATGERVIFMVRVWCDEDEVERTQQVIDEAILQMFENGIEAERLLVMQEALVESIGRYFGTAKYWSQRLSVLGMKDQRVDDLWRIREGYLEIEALEVVEVLNALMAKNDQFMIRIVEEK